MFTFLPLSQASSLKTNTGGGVEKGLHSVSDRAHRTALRGDHRAIGLVPPARLPGEASAAPSLSLGFTTSNGQARETPLLLLQLLHMLPMLLPPCERI